MRAAAMRAAVRPGSRAAGRRAAGRALPRPPRVLAALVLATALLATACAGTAVRPACADQAEAATSSAASAPAASSGASAAGTGIDADDIGKLSDRYESLDELANSMNSDDNVVIETRIAVLSSVNRALDGTSVRVSGEAVGNAVNADDGHKWASLEDSSGATMSVYLSDELESKIANYGGYNKVGTTVTVTGEYHVACPEHQGELDLHASRLVVTDAGGAAEHAVSPGKLVAGVALSAVGLFLIVVFVILRRRRDKREQEQRRAER